MWAANMVIELAVKYNKASVNGLIARLTKAVEALPIEDEQTEGSV